MYGVNNRLTHNHFQTLVRRLFDRLAQRYLYASYPIVRLLHHDTVQQPTAIYCSRP